MSGNIASNDQCTAAVKYLKAHANESNIDKAEFERASGIGITVSDSDVQSVVAEVLKANASAIQDERYAFNFKKLLQPIKQIGDMAWADIGRITAEIDKQKCELLGPETEEDKQRQAQPAKAKAKAAKKAKAPVVRPDVKPVRTQSVAFATVMGLMPGNAHATVWGENWFKRLQQHPIV